MTPDAVDRRTVLQGAVVGSAALLSGCSAQGNDSADPGSAVRRTVGASPSAHQPDTNPPESAWRALAAGLDGDLVRPGDGDYFEAKELFNPRWDAYRPLAVVEATTADDVSESITFAQKYALRVRPKAGGHSYVGASSATGVIVISTARMTAVHYHPAGSVALVGAGAKLYHVHAALAGHGRTIPTGTCPTVGTAGLTMGGGLGVASRGYGLTSDQLFSARIVTADGVIRTASAGSNPDLLWALRGGGGGNFGIVTQLDYHTQPTTSLGFFLMSFPWSSAAAVVRGWSRRIKKMPHSSWANLHVEANSDGSAEVRIVGVCAPGDESGEAQAMEAEIGVDASSTSLFVKTYLAAVQFLGGGTTSPRQGWAAGSDILPTMTVPVSQALVRVIAQRAASRKAGVAILDPLTGQVRAHDPQGTAFPWRRHLCSIQWYLGMPDHPTIDQIHAAYNWIDTAHDSVAAISVGGYVNYLEPRRHVASYYGANFARLRSVKRAHDPHNFFDTPWSIPT
jgi:FAD/FMN-containing dehydrogenase